MPINSQLKTLINQAILEQTTDIYFKAAKQDYQVQFRLPGGLIKQQALTLETTKRFLASLKYLANLDVNECRRVQNGRILWCYEKQHYYLRLATLGDFNNQELMVIRIIYPLSKLEIISPHLLKLANNLPANGLVLFSGATGSGKTTSMYQLAKLRQQQTVVTIEDPVEIIEPEFMQLQVNERANQGYGTLLKTSLRLRPDILIVGEIRDELTATYAIHAALSGHLVLSTLHANNHLGVITRLIELGVNQTHLLSCLQAVIYQRLIPNQSQFECDQKILNHEAIEELVKNAN